MRKTGPTTLIRPTRYRLPLLLALLAVTIAAMLRWWPRSERSIVAPRNTEALD
jgi:hypothetical protein